MYKKKTERSVTGNKIFKNSFVNNSIDSCDNGKTEWYGQAPSNGNALSPIMGYLDLAEPENIGNYYDD